MSEAEVRNVANEVLADILNASRFDPADVRLSLDHDGDTSFFVTAHVRLGSGIFGGELWMHAHTALWRRLLAVGEERSPYLEFRYADDEVLAGDGEAQTV